MTSNGFRRWLSALWIAGAIAGCTADAGLDSTAPAPGTVSVEAVALNSMKVRWSAVGDDNVTGYRLERRANLSGSFATVAEEVPQVAGGVVEYFDTSVQPDTYYGYRVIALDRFGKASESSLVGGAKTPPMPGIDVKVSRGSAGSAADPDGYTLVIAGMDTTISTALAPAEDRRFSPLAAGEYTVTLRGLAGNCGLQGDSVRTITVTDQGIQTISTVDYGIVACSDPTRGAIRAVVSVTGGGADSSGFQLRLTGVPTDTVGADKPDAIFRDVPLASETGGTFVFDTLRPGSYQVELRNVAQNCTREGPAAQTAQVAPLSADTFAFVVHCPLVDTNDPDDPTRPYKLRTTWSASSAAVGSTVTLTAKFDLTASTPLSVSAIQANLLFDPQVLRFDGFVGQTPWGVTVNSANPGAILWLAVNGSPTSVTEVEPVRFTFTVLGGAGTTVRPATSIVSIADENGDEYQTQTQPRDAALSITAAGGGGGGGGGTTNQSPTANAGGPYSGVAGTAITFSGAGSSDASPGSIASYTWNWGDGSAAGSGTAPTHAYAAAGTYTVTLTVTDNEGATGTATAQVTVTAPGGGGGGGGGSSSLIWRSQFGAIQTAGSDRVVRLTIAVDLSANLPETPGVEKLSDFTVDSLKWDPAVLGSAGVTFGSGISGSSSVDDLNGNARFSGHLGVAGSGVVTVATVLFTVKGGSGAATTTVTKLGQVVGVGYDYTAQTVVQEGSLTLP